MIALENVTFCYNEKKVIDSLSINIKNGCCVCLSGESGCGKTTILRLILGLEVPQSGFVIAPHKISAVFQEDRLVPHLNIISNLNLCLSEKQEKFAMSLLEEAGMKNTAQLKPDELSGGMKRRVSIVRAVAFGGDALLLDEPFNGLDYESKTKMAEMIKREFIQKNKPVIMVSHIPEDAELLNAKIIKIKDFRI